MRMISPVIAPWLPDSYALPQFIETLSDAFGLPHLISSTSLGALELSSTNGDGHTAIFGAGNSTLHYLHLFDHTSNIEFGLEDHYRTGDYVNPVNGVATMDAGIQNGLHNEQGVNANRSAASFDISLNFGNEGPTDGKFVLDINGHDYTLAHTGANWYFADSHGTPVQGLTLSANGHLLQDSANLAFFSNILVHGTNTADIKPQDVHISLTETANTFVGTVGVAQVAETIHLV